MGFLNDTLSPGALLLITATMRAGKSNFANCLIEQLIQSNKNVYANLLYFKKKELDEAIKEGILKQKKEYYRRIPSELKTVTTMTELILGLYSTKNNISVLDEAQLFAGAKKGVSKDIRWFEGFITQSGKLDSATILITQFKSRLGTMLKQDIPTYECKVFKRSFYDRYVEIWFNPPQDISDPDNEESYLVDTWYDIPPTHYPYDHLAPAGFEIDLDIEGLINRISKLNSLQVRKQIPVIIKEMTQGTIEKKKLTKKELIMNEFYNDTNLTLKGLAKKYKTSYQNVKNIHNDFLRENE
jgi:hypothetical protein